MSAGMPGDEDADRVVDPPLEDREESPFGPPGVRSIRRGDGGDIAGVVGTGITVALLDGVLVADPGTPNDAVRFF